MTDLELVPCDPARDGELIRELTRRNFHELMQAEWNEARHQQEPKHPERYTMVRRAGETIGFFALRRESDHVYVQTIQLVESARGQGIGTQLMEHIHALARDDGVATIRLRVLRANTGARRLYERLGYVVIAEEDGSLLLQLSDLRTVVTPRLELVLLDHAYLAAVVAGEPVPDRGFSDPHGFLLGAEDVVALRLLQIEEAPAQEPWLLRAIVTRDDRVAVGFINFHAAPDARGMVELGYEVLAEFRGRGFATEAAEAMIAWAAQHGARIVRASVSPDNAPSLAMIARMGFVQVGEQLDEVDGLELVFERPLRRTETRLP